MNSEQLDRALDEIGFQAALEWAPTRASSLKGVIVSIAAQPNAKERKTDRLLIGKLQTNVAEILEALPELSPSIRQIIDGPASATSDDVETLVALQDILSKLQPSLQFAVEVTEDERQRRGKPPAKQERRVIEACAEIFVLAENRRPPWGKDDEGSPTGKFSKGVAAVLDAIGLSSKNSVNLCQEICSKFDENKIEKIRRHGALQRHLKEKR